jgi:membrane protein implicated in regulation of membrane protease activity
MDAIQIVAAVLFVIVLITLVWRIRSRRSKS